MAILAAIALVVVGAIGAMAWRDAQRTRALESQMSQIARAMRAHADQAPREIYAPLSSQPGILFMDAATLFPAYLEDPAVVVSPRRPNVRGLRRQLAAATLDGHTNPAVIEQVGAESFHYLGYTVAYEITGMAWVDAYREAVHTHTDGPIMEAYAITVQFPEDYAGPRTPPDLAEWGGWFGTGPGSAGGDQIHRLRGGIERFLISDGAVSGPRASAQERSNILLLIERPSHIGAPIHVAYFDGHVARVPHGQFPNTRPFLEALESLRDLAGSASHNPAYRQ